MNENNSFEAELAHLRPAGPPQDFLARLRSCRPPRPAASACPAPLFLPPWRQWARLLLPAGAVATLALLAARFGLPPASQNQETSRNGTAANIPALKADDIRIDRELVTSFDAVARLPGGEPVRFRCREWVDNVVWQDKQRGVTVERREPRIEVVPVRFETY